MKYGLELGGDPQALTMTLAGPVDARSIRAFVEDLVAQPEYRSGMLIFADLSALDTSTITAEQYETVSDVLTGRDLRFPAKAIAIVAPGARTFDDALRHRAYVGGSKSHREVFRGCADATAWLAQER